VSFALTVGQDPVYWVTLAGLHIPCAANQRKFEAGRKLPSSIKNSCRSTWWPKGNGNANGKTDPKANNVKCSPAQDNKSNNAESKFSTSFSHTHAHRRGFTL